MLQTAPGRLSRCRVVAGIRLFQVLTHLVCGFCSGLVNSLMTAWYRGQSLPPTNLGCCRPHGADCNALVRHRTEVSMLGPSWQRLRFAIWFKLNNVVTSIGPVAWLNDVSNRVLVYESKSSFAPGQRHTIGKLAM